MVSFLRILRTIQSKFLTSDNEVENYLGTQDFKEEVTVPFLKKAQSTLFRTNWRSVGIIVGTGWDIQETGKL